MDILFTLAEFKEAFPELGDITEQQFDNEYVTHYYTYGGFDGWGIDNRKVGLQLAIADGIFTLTPTAKRFKTRYDEVEYFEAVGGLSPYKVKLNTLINYLASKPGIIGAGYTYGVYGRGC